MKTLFYSGSLKSNLLRLMNLLEKYKFANHQITQNMRLGNKGKAASARKVRTALEEKINQELIKVNSIETGIYRVTLDIREFPGALDNAHIQMRYLKVEDSRDIPLYISFLSQKIGKEIRIVKIEPIINPKLD